MLGALLLAACEGEQPEAAPAEKVAEPAADQGGRLLDLAEALDPDEETALARRLARQQQADGRPVMVVVIETGETQSLEQLGWAVGGGGSGIRPHLLLVDPAARRVRIEGDLRPEARAQVAAAMQSELTSGRVAAAIDRGLVQLERMAP